MAGTMDAAYSVMHQRVVQVMEKIKHCKHGVGSKRCVIISKLPALNFVLWNTQLQLQQTTPGRICLTTIFPGRQLESMDERLARLARYLLKFVLRRHHCIVSIDIESINLREPTNALLQILIHKVPSLVSLRISDGFTTAEDLSSLASALVTAFSLKDLGLQSVLPLNGLCALLLHTFFSRTDTLTTVSIGHVEHEHASLLLKGLERNTTVQTLTLSTCTCFQGTPHGSPLVAVLTQMNALRTLNLSRCCFQCRMGLNAIMQALVDNRRLLTLSLRGFACCEAFRELMPLLLTRNSALRKLHVQYSSGYNMAECPCKSLVQKGACCANDSVADYRASVAPLTAGISRNEWLEELTVDLTESSLSECDSFFQNIQLNRALRRVVISNMRHEDAVEICAAIRRHSVGRIVSIQCPFVISDSVEAVVLCSQMSSILIDELQVIDEELLYSAMRQLPRWDHVKCVALVFSPNQLASVLDPLLHYVRTTTTLRELQLEIEGAVAEAIIRRSLLTTLLGNRSLRSLRIQGGMLVRATEAQVVAHELAANDTLCQLALFEDQEEDDDLLSFQVLLIWLFPDLSANFTLCELEHEAVPYSTNLQLLQAVLNRNREYAMRAAHYAVGTDRSDYCSRAMRLVWDNPQVLLNVMEMASIREDEAAARIQRTLVEQALENRYLIPRP